MWRCRCVISSIIGIVYWTITSRIYLTNWGQMMWNSCALILISVYEDGQTSNVLYSLYKIAHIIMRLRCVVVVVMYAQLRTLNSPVIQITLLWRHNERKGVSNYRCLDCLFNRLFRRRSKKTSKLHVTGLCEGNPPVTGGFLSQKASNAENASTWWRHHELSLQGP